MAWDKLLDIYAEMRQIATEDAVKAPVECPNDYTALREGPDGVLYCPWDGWQHPGDA